MDLGVEKRAVHNNSANLFRLEDLFGNELLDAARGADGDARLAGGEGGLVVGELVFFNELEGAAADGLECASDVAHADGGDGQDENVLEGGGVGGLFLVVVVVVLLFTVLLLGLGEQILEN